MLEFSTCIVGEKVPVDLGLPVITVVLPHSDVALHGFKVGNSRARPLPTKGAKLAPRRVQPAAMFGCVMNFKTFRQPPCLLRFERFVEGSKAVRVQIIQYKTYLNGVWVECVKNAFDPPRPI